MFGALGKLILGQIAANAQTNQVATTVSLQFNGVPIAFGEALLVFVTL